jgi:hypothetical protein
MEPHLDSMHDVPDTSLPANDVYRTGDVLNDSEHTPIGTINTVLRAASGVRLVVAVAGYHNRYVVVPATEIVGDLAPPFGPATRHITSAPRLAILNGPTYRREMGRLTKDTSRLDPFPFPTGAGWEGADTVTRTAVRDGLAQSRLTSEEPIEFDVWHGAVYLYGRVATDAGVIDGIRIAHAADGVWHVISTLVSDEALRMQLRRLVRGSDAAADVAAVTVVRGVGIVTTFAGATVDPASLALWQASTPGLATITMGPSRLQ